MPLCTCFHQCGKDQAKKYIQLVMMAVCVKLLFGFLRPSNLVGKGFSQEMLLKFQAL